MLRNYNFWNLQQMNALLSGDFSFKKTSQHFHKNPIKEPIAFTNSKISDYIKKDVSPPPFPSFGTISNYRKLRSRLITGNLNLRM